MKKCKMGFVRLMLSLLATAGIANHAVADLIIHISGTANSSALGYTAGTTNTFTWTVNNNFSQTPGSSFTASMNYWDEATVADTPIFTDLSGDGLSGTWVRPTASSTDPYSYLSMWDYGTPQLALYSATEGSSGIGLQANGVDLRRITAFNLEIGNIFAFDQAYISPTNYFAELGGSYTPTGGEIEIVDITGSTTLTLTATNVTIDAVPEPAVISLIGLAGGALYFAKRFQTRRKEQSEDAG